MPLKPAGFQLPDIRSQFVEAGAISRSVFIQLGMISKAADSIQGLMIEGFTRGIGDAYWLALMAAVIGLLAIVAIDKKRLKRVDGRA